MEAINAISGERCSPHPHNFTDRLIRPGDQAFFDIIQSFVAFASTINGGSVFEWPESSAGPVNVEIVDYH